MTQSVFDFDVPTATGGTQSLSGFEGKVLLIVNTASRCGFTGQYQGLQQLQSEYGDKGLQILAFPCNQFGRQESGSNEEIQQFCEQRYQVTFPVFAKVKVNGKDSLPLYEFLRSEAPGLLNSESIKWNFTKFLIDSQGRVVSASHPAKPPMNFAAT